MNLLNNWLFYISLYLIFSVTFNQCYKITTKKMKNAGAITVLISGIAGIFSLLMIPFFEMKMPTKISSYIFLGLACIFYALNDRISTTARKGIEASTFSIIKQFSTVFMIFAGILFFKEELVLNKIIGAFLIIFSNILVFYQKNYFKIDKYICLGIIANLCLTIALFIDVNCSNQFNLPTYISITFLIPFVLIFLIEKIKIKDIINEYKNGNKIIIFLTSLSWSIMMISKLRAYQLGQVTLVAPLCSLTVILDVIISYLLLKERNNLSRKILAGILIIISVILIKL